MGQLKQENYFGEPNLFQPKKANLLKPTIQKNVSIRRQSPCKKNTEFHSSYLVQTLITFYNLESSAGSVAKSFSESLIL